ncbi:MAG TPA: YIP1 family protein [Longimicrobium sp.]|nr:YIP1 family protein [Longimicrobium sp.]
MSTTAHYVPGADAAPEAPMRGFFARAVDVLLSPGRVMAELAGASRPPWAGPAFLAAGVMAALTVLTLVLVPRDELARFIFEQATRNGNPRGLTVEQMQPMIPIQMAGGAVAVVAWAFLRVFLIGAVLLLAFTTVGGGSARFAHYRAVVSHAGIVSLVGFVAEWALRLFSGKLDLALNLSILAPGMDEKGLAFVFLRSLNIFTLWAFVVVGIGVSAANRRKWTGATFALLTVLMLAFAAVGWAIGSAMAGGAS